jgi:hypothetical protein
MGKLVTGWRVRERICGLGVLLGWFVESSAYRIWLGNCFDLKHFEIFLHEFGMF